MRSKEEIKKRYATICDMIDYQHNTGTYIRPDRVYEHKVLKWVLNDEE